MNHLKNIGALKADYEAGTYSRVDIATKQESLLSPCGVMPARVNGAMVK